MCGRLREHSRGYSGNRYEHLQRHKRALGVRDQLGVCNFSNVKLIK